MLRLVLYARDSAWSPVEEEHSERLQEDRGAATECGKEKQTQGGRNAIFFIYVLLLIMYRCVCVRTRVHLRMHASEHVHTSAGACRG